MKSKRVYFDASTDGIGECQMWGFEGENVLHILTVNGLKLVKFSNFENMLSFFDWLVYSEGGAFGRAVSTEVVVIR